MADTLSKPGHYWDFRECRWVPCEAPGQVAVPEQTQPADATADAAEADAPAG